MFKKLLITTILCITSLCCLSVNAMERYYTESDIDDLISEYSNNTTLNDSIDELINKNSTIKDSLDTKIFIEDELEKRKQNIAEQLKLIENNIKEIENVRSIADLKENYSNDYVDCIYYLAKCRQELFNIINKTKHYYIKYKDFKNLASDFINLHCSAQDLLSKARLLHERE